MKKENLFKIEYIIYLFPVSIFFPTFFFNDPILNKIRLDNLLVIIIFFYMLVNFFINPWLPRLKILLLGLLVFLHVIIGILLTDFSSGNVRYVKLFGYLESYLSFIVIIFFIDYYYTHYPNKIKQTLNKIIQYYILSSFFVLSIIIVLFFFAFNTFLTTLFSSDPSMLRKAYDAGRYIGSISMPVEVGFYSAFGMIVTVYAYKLRVIKKFFFFVSGFLLFNIIGVIGGSKVYIVGVFIVFLVCLAIFFVTREKLYRSISIFILFVQLLISVTSSFFLDTLSYEKKLYILKYYDLKNYSSISHILPLVSGNRIQHENQPSQMDKLALKEFIENKIHDEKSLLAIIKKLESSNQYQKITLDYLKNDNKFRFDGKKLKSFEKIYGGTLSQVGLQVVQILKSKNLKYFEYQGAFDSQHKMIAGHGGIVSVVFLIFFYFLLFVSGLKIYLINNVLGIFLISFTFLSIISSTGFPIFFSNKLFFFNCIIICALLLINTDKARFKS
jgi:hypothetical protein